MKTTNKALSIGVAVVVIAAVLFLALNAALAGILGDADGLMGAGGDADPTAGRPHPAEDD